jgi:hypothetical protein
MLESVILIIIIIIIIVVVVIIIIIISTLYIELTAKILDIYQCKKRIVENYTVAL